MENRQGGGNAKWVLGCIVLVVSLLVSCTIGAVEAAGEQHQVGGVPGWSLPSRANVNYTVWASSQSFKVGDTLYFNYSSQYHNVLEVTQAKYDKCDASDPIKQWDDGATVVPLNMTGTFYYICGIPTHCDLGQKVSVTVGASSSSSPSSATPPPPPASSSPLSLYTHPISPLDSLLALFLIINVVLPY